MTNKKLELNTLLGRLETPEGDRGADSSIRLFCDWFVDVDGWWPWKYFMIEAVPCQFAYLSNIDEYYSLWFALLIKQIMCSSSEFNYQFWGKISPDTSQNVQFLKHQPVDNDHKIYWSLANHVHC